MERVWQLLSTLPTQPALSQGLSSLATISDDGEGWATLLDPEPREPLILASACLCRFLISGTHAILFVQGYVN